ncbi:MAG: class I SAM-dependent methyltransferase [Vulcanimicrobiota bacterium]
MLEAPLTPPPWPSGPRNIHDLQALWAELRHWFVRRSDYVAGAARLDAQAGCMVFTRHVLPAWSSFISGDNSAYCYLCNTIASFMDREQLSQSMREGGLLHVRSIPLTFGVVTVHVATVP